MPGEYEWIFLLLFIITAIGIPVVIIKLYLKNKALKKENEELKSEENKYSK